ncbi:DUF3829 domain-containing protein [Clostridium saccharoperbutylacetonicum]|uniref:DUF3829 domain-containing protein n=1 Tax=Clostridium saccharoperbutylacetonicum TaxID=36745 RepID=UPI0039E9F5D5
MHVSFNYKTYEESKIATIFSITGGVFNIFGRIIPVTFIAQLIKTIGGNSETLKYKYNPNKVDMGPILKEKYDNIEKVKKAANSNPKIEIDEDVIKLADATQKVYDLISLFISCEIKQIIK